MPSSINIQMFPFDESSEIKLKLQLFYKEQGVRTSAVIDAGIKYKDGCLTLYFEEVLTSKNLDNYRLWIERRLADRSQKERKTRVINVSDGAWIEGMEHEPDWIDQWD